MSTYCDDALAYLRHAYDSERAIFSRMSTVGADGKIINDWSMRDSLRYTINAYLGLVEAERHLGPVDWIGNVADRVRQFISLHDELIVSVADRGLLLVLLAQVDLDHPAVARSLDAIETAIDERDAIKHLNMQDLAWMLWGATALDGDPRAAAIAHRIFGMIRGNFVHPTSGMPRHSTRRYRWHTVSFGSIVYFLRAMHEYADTFGSEDARSLFTNCLRRVLALQGTDGGWPWLIDVRTVMPIDIYPIFSVHQDSMAMLFLFPAKSYGIEGLDDVIERSVRWNFGHNELKESLIRQELCPWFDRSIERDEDRPRLRRYLRGLGRPKRVYPLRSEHVRFNRECRSYHLGWVLYTWSGRPAPRLDAYAPEAKAVGTAEVESVR